MPPVNFNATAQRMVGGSMAPQQPQAPVVKAFSPVPLGAGNNPFNYGAGKATSYGGKGKSAYDPYRLAREQYDSLYARGRYAGGREVDANAAYDNALADPTKQAQMFQGFYGDATNAMAAPILRQFQMALGNNVGASASRFGGNTGSTEQAKGEFNTGDVFSRNLAEMIRSQAGASVNAGMDYTNMLGQRAGAAAGTVENNDQLKAGVGQNTKKPKSGVGSFLGGVLGGGIGALTGGFGAGLGKQVGGG